jgi:hypothetical protein
MLPVFGAWHSVRSSFMPTGKGVAAGATIADGRYVVEGARGPTPGEYRVEIRASAPNQFDYSLSTSRE